MFDGLLIHTAEVWRGDDRVDRFGQPEAPIDPMFVYRCRVTRPSGGETMGERSLEVFQVSHTAYFHRDADIREDDLVRIYDSAATELVPLANVKLKRVVYDGVGPHHLEVLLEVQRGPM